MNILILDDDFIRHKQFKKAKGENMKIQRYDNSLMPNQCGRWVDYCQVKQIKNKSFRYGVLVGACASIVGAVLSAILF